MVSSNEPGFDAQEDGHEVKSNEKRSCCWIGKNEERDEMLETYKREDWTRKRREGEFGQLELKRRPMLRAVQWT